MRVRLGIVVLLLGALALTGLAPAREAYQQQQRIDAEEKKLIALQRENKELQGRLERLNNPDYVEKLAREQLGLVKPGETAYVVVPPPAEVTTQTAKAPKPKSLPVRIWETVRRAILGEGSS